MRSAFRCGSLRATADLLAVIDRPTLVRAILAHFTTQPAYDGQPIRTAHTHGNRRFVVETPSTRDQTIIRLEQP